MNALMDQSMLDQVRVSACVGLPIWHQRALMVVTTKKPARGQQEVKT